ncbi:MAG: hypothetical protein H7A36_01110 [Chlamydiales bacterium]|nr:hypothetical protein [Chlamydiales bacterium]
MGVQVPPFAMGRLVATFFLILAAPLLAVRVDPTSKGFDNHEKRQHVDTFDFSGLYPHLENIDIDAVRKKNVEIDLSGEYPLLHSICYDGTFGMCKGLLTGTFPMLSDIDITVTSNKVKLDLRGDWQKNCEINIRGTSADIVLELPKSVGLDIYAKRSVSGKISAKDGLKKKGFGQLRKHFVANPDAEVTLTLNLEVTSGTIVLK